MPYGIWFHKSESSINKAKNHHKVKNDNASEDEDDEMEQFENEN